MPKMFPNPNWNDAPMTRGQRRVWLALEAQKRRRARLQPVDPPPAVPNAPVLLTGDYQWNRTMQGYADVMLTWSFDHGSFPVASLEIWANVNTAGYQQLATVPSNTSNIVSPNATNVPIFVRVKLRYRNGITVGPFSNELLIYVQFQS